MIKWLKRLFCNHNWKIITPSSKYRCGTMPCQRCKYEGYFNGTYYCDKFNPNYPVIDEGCGDFRYSKAIIKQCTKCGKVKE